MTRPSPRRAGAALAALISGFSFGCATLPPPSLAPGSDALVVDHVPVRTFEDDRCGPGSLSLVLNALGDPVSEEELEAALPRAPGGGVLSVDLLLLARQRGFDAALVVGDAETVGSEIGGGRPTILLLRLLDAPGRRHDIFHYVVVDGMDAKRRLFRFQFGDGKVRWARLEALEGAWKGAGHAQLTVRAPEVLARMRAALALERAGHLDEAAAHYREILEDHPRHVRAWVDLGNVEAARLRRHAAETAYRHALEIAPGDTDALNNLAWLLLEEGERLGEAEGLARAAAGAGSKRALVLDTLARIQGARGRCGEAAATLAEGLGQPGLSSAARSALERTREEIRRWGCPGP